MCLMLNHRLPWLPSVPLLSLALVQVGTVGQADTGVETSQLRTLLFNTCPELPVWLRSCYRLCRCHSKQRLCYPEAHRLVVKDNYTVISTRKEIYRRRGWRAAEGSQFEQGSQATDSLVVQCMLSPEFEPH